MLYRLLHHNPMITCHQQCYVTAVEAEFLPQAEGLDKIGSAANTCLVAAEVSQAGGEEDVVGRVPRNYKMRYLSS